MNDTTSKGISGRAMVRLPGDSRRMDKLRVGINVLGAGNDGKMAPKKIIAIAVGFYPESRMMYRPTASARGDPGLVTAWHPVMSPGSKWCFPCESNDWEEVPGPHEELYALALEDGWHPVLGSDASWSIAAGVGHYSANPILAHSFFGDYRCVADMILASLIQPRNELGIAVIRERVRDPATGRVCEWRFDVPRDASESEDKNDTNDDSQVVPKTPAASCAAGAGGLE